MRKWAAQLDRQCRANKLAYLRHHRSFEKRIKNLKGTGPQKMRSVLEMVDEDFDWLEANLRRVCRDTVDSSQADGTRILNLMLPKGVSPRSESKDIFERVWNRNSFNSTVEGRLAHNRVKMRKRMTRPFTSSLKERTLRPGWTEEMEEEYELAQQVIREWESGEWLGAVLAENEPWTTGLVSMAYEMDTKGEDLDVIDHWEFLATLDGVTCEECGALDGTDLGESLGLEGSSLEIDQDISIHPNCRCVAIPITKTWEELGFPPTAEPEGTRISRPTSEGRASPTGYIHPDGSIKPNWVPGAEPVGGNQKYVPADTRYEDWIRRQQ